MSVAENSKLFCLKHWFVNLSENRTGSNKLAKAIEAQLISQNYKCAYSDILLILGVNAQLDHKIPISKGGTNTPGNLHWVEKEVNRMKGNRTHNEFVNLCKYIALKYN